MINKSINLQLFAGDEKTEKATPKKKQDARKKGQVLQSKEVTSALALLGSMLFLKFFGKYMAGVICESFVFFKNNFLYVDFNDAKMGYTATVYMMYFIFKASIGILLLNAAVGAIITYAQVGTIFTTETLRFDLTKLNPISGMQRMFSIRSVVELIKSCLKLLILAFVAYGFLKKNIAIILKTIYIDKFQFSYAMYSLAINLAIRLSFVLCAMAVFDYFYQWYEFEKNLKMSKQDIKDEYKQSEGDPQIKSKIKQKQRESAMRRMMQDVPSADVIITNPTHFAIAIKYDENKYDAPYIVAKGADFIAQKIKEKGKENDIPIVENKPLARQLYSLVEVGDVVPPELYEAVAQILAYVYSLKK